MTDSPGYLLLVGRFVNDIADVGVLETVAGLRCADRADSRVEVEMQFSGLVATGARRTAGPARVHSPRPSRSAPTLTRLDPFAGPGPYTRRPTPATGGTRQSAAGSTPSTVVIGNGLQGVGVLVGGEAAAVGVRDVFGVQGA